ncbi:NUDIX domain protein, partial [Bimuria novae-zelandiae CBS 107.79]
MARAAAYNFDHHTSVADFTVPKHAYLAARSDASFGYIATSALVLDTTTASGPRVLLLQRAASDEDPNKWEPPGGACDDEDPSILNAAARELWEEAGLIVAQIGGVIGTPHFFTLEDGKRVCQFNFVMQVENDAGTPPAVRLDPNEHQQYVWATENEVKIKEVGDINLDFTREEVRQTVLLVFDYYRETMAKEKT